jgi:hypothetical protein
MAPTVISRDASAPLQGAFPSSVDAVQLKSIAASFAGASFGSFRALCVSRKKEYTAVETRNAVRFSEGQIATRGVAMRSTSLATRYSIGEWIPSLLICGFWAARAIADWFEWNPSGQFANWATVILVCALVIFLVFENGQLKSRIGSLEKEIADLRPGLLS